MSLVGVGRQEARERCDKRGDPLSWGELVDNGLLFTTVVNTFLELDVPPA